MFAGARFRRTAIAHLADRHAVCSPKSPALFVKAISSIALANDAHTRGIAASGIGSDDAKGGQ
jgi:hypothetical protein